MCVYIEEEEATSGEEGAENGLWWWGTPLGLWAGFSKLPGQTALLKLHYSCPGSPMWGRKYCRFWSSSTAEDGALWPWAQGRLGARPSVSP